MWRIILLLSCVICSTVFADTYKSLKVGERKPIVSAKTYKASKFVTRKYYTGFEAGYSYTLKLNNNFRKESVDDSGQLGFFVGRMLSHNCRVEVEGNYKTKLTAKKPVGAMSAEQRFESFTGFLNLYKSWDYNSSELVQPFVMVGVGYAHNIAGDYKTSSVSILGKNTNNFAYQFGGGISTQLNKDAYMDFSLRYANRGRADTSNVSVNTSGVVSYASKEKSVIKDVIGLVNLRFYL